MKKPRLLGGAYVANVMLWVQNSYDDKESGAELFRQVIHLSLRSIHCATHRLKRI